MIRVRNLTKDFGGRRAVDDISFTVDKGEIVGFLGPNGAGKTTTMRMLTGYLTPTAGRTCGSAIDVMADRTVRDSGASATSPRSTRSTPT